MMFSCPQCGGRISIWRNKETFPCGSCGTALKTNGRTAHVIANVLAGFGSLVFLAVPGNSELVQILVMLATYVAVYFVVIGFSFQIRAVSHETR